KATLQEAGSLMNWGSQFAPEEYTAMADTTTTPATMTDTTVDLCIARSFRFSTSDQYSADPQCRAKKKMRDHIASHRHKKAAPVSDLGKHRKRNPPQDKTPKAKQAIQDLPY